MKLNWMKVSHLFGLRNAEFNFDESNLISIVGENGSGKSSIMDCVVFALLGHATPSRGVKIEDYIRRGADVGSVELVFTDMSGTQRKVKRNLKLSKSRNVTNQASLYTYDEKSGEWLNESDMLSDIQLKIASILMKGKIEGGSQEELKAQAKQAEAALLISAFISQGNIAQILSVTPNERMNLIASAFNITGSDRLKTESSELRKIADGEYKEIQAVKTALRERLNGLGESREELEANQKRFADSALESSKLMTAYHNIYSAINALIKTTADYDAAKQKAQVSEKKFREAQNYEAAKTSTEAHKDYIKAAEELKDGVLSMKSLRQKRDIEQNAATALQADLQAARQSAQQAQGKYNETEHMASYAPNFRKERELLKDLAELSKELADLKTALANNQQESAQHGTALKQALFNEAVLEYKEQQNKLLLAETAQKEKEEAETTFNKTKALADKFPALKEKEETAGKLEELKTELSGIWERIKALTSSIGECDKKVLEYTKMSAWLRFNTARTTYMSAQEELAEIEKRIVSTLVALLYQLSDNGIIDLNNISLDSEKATAWAEAFENSEFKTLVQTSGALKDKVNSSKAAMEELYKEYPFLKEEQQEADISLSLNELEAKKHETTLAKARLETELNAAKGNEDKTLRRVEELENNVKQLDTALIGYGAAEIKAAEDQFAEVKTALDDAVRKSIQANKEACGVEEKIKDLVEKYPEISSNLSTTDDQPTGTALQEAREKIQSYRVAIAKLDTTAQSLETNISGLNVKIKTKQEELETTSQTLPDDVTEETAYKAEKERSTVLGEYRTANDKLHAAKEKVVTSEAEIDKLAKEIELLGASIDRRKKETAEKAKVRFEALRAYSEANGLTMAEAIKTAETIKKPDGYISLDNAREVYSKDHGTYTALSAQMQKQQKDVVELIDSQNVPVQIAKDFSNASSKEAFDLSKKYDAEYREAERMAASYRERIKQYDLTKQQIDEKERSLEEIEPLRKYAQTLAQMADGNNFSKFMSDTAMSVLLDGVNSYLVRIGEKWKVASKDGELFVLSEGTTPRPVSGMSGGEQVLISVLLLKHISNFGCLWLDESLPNLDERRLEKTVGILTSEADSQLLLTTHDPELARQFPKMWEMEDGTLKETQKAEAETATEI